MKGSRLIFFFTLIVFCFAEDPDDCSTKFESILVDKCSLISSKCGYNSEKRICREECSSGTVETCSGITPPNYHTHRCSYDSSSRTCIPIQRECTSWNGVYDEDDCSKLKSPDGNGYRCDILSYGAQCSSYSNDCSGFDGDQSGCNDHTPFEYTSKCLYNTGEGKCNKVPRNCGDNFYKMNINLCHNLTPTDSQKKCFFVGNSCHENYEGCKGYNEGQCNSGKPLIKNESGDDYDILKKCYWLSSTGVCESRNKNCYDFVDTGDEKKNEELCNRLEAIEPNKKKCVYDDQKCIEEYRSCQLYNENETKKTREECERIIPTAPNKLCYFKEEENQCEERDIFTNCEDYKGNDKNICESIISKATNSRCILEKDSTCKERAFHCNDTDIKYQCLTYAKPKDNNKKCVYSENHSPKCFEEYKTCEDYLKSGTNNLCSSIKLYNGKECIYEQDRCRSNNIICKDTSDEDECKLINKTGVSDPDIKVCQYDKINHECFENYKYCSDYRGENNTICENIKPYDESGENLDITSHCTMDLIVGCKRIPYKCTNANDAFKCASISPYIKDNKIKYCAYYNGQCREYYKKCEDADPASECSRNIPFNFSKPNCEAITVTGVKSCKNKEDCASFDPEFYSNLCYSLSPNCSYDVTNHKCYTETEKTCEDLKFYIASDNNEEVCKSYEPSDPNKICSLEENKLKCEVIDKGQISPPSDPSNQESSSRFMKKTMNLIIITLILLF